MTNAFVSFEQLGPDREMLWPSTVMKTFDEICDENSCLSVNPNINNNDMSLILM